MIKYKRGCVRKHILFSLYKVPQAFIAGLLAFVSYDI